MANICLNYLTIKSDDTKVIRYLKQHYGCKGYDFTDLHGSNDFLSKQWCDETPVGVKNTLKLYSETRWQPDIFLVEALVLLLGRQFTCRIIAELVFDEPSSFGSGKYSYTYLSKTDALDIKEDDADYLCCCIHETSFDDFMELEQVTNLMEQHCLCFQTGEKDQLSFYIFCLEQMEFGFPIVLSCHEGVYNAFYDKGTMPRLEHLMLNWSKQRKTECV